MIYSLDMARVGQKLYNATTKEIKWYFVFYSQQVLYENYLRQHDQHPRKMCMFQ